MLNKTSLVSIIRIAACEILKLRHVFILGTTENPTNMICEMLLLLFLLLFQWIASIELLKEKKNYFVLCM